VVVSCLAIALGAGVTGQTGAKGGSVLRYAISRHPLSEVNPSDALAATLVWAKAIGQTVGAWSDAKAQLVEDNDAIVRLVNTDATDLIALSTVEYLAIEHQMKAEPALAYEEGGHQVGTELVLLVRGHAIGSVADLKGKRVAFFTPSDNRDLADTWLDVLLSDAGLGEKDRSIQLKPVRKRGQAALALYFNQVDAAIESRWAFATAAELNPQLGRDLRVLAESPRLLSAVVCLRSSINPSLRRQILECATNLHKQSAYRQTFLLMRATRFVTWEPRYLDGTRALMARYDALHRSTADRPRR
jgi:ABC-type phosphate/phosphonate transport system substrate-binding protein